jgi:anti-sigma B factor antagonist
MDTRELTGVGLRRAPLNRIVPVTFRCPRSLAGSAERVSLIGPFNGWTPNVHTLRRTTDGEWTLTLYLVPGRTVYCFDVDGTIWLDPYDEGRMANDWGSECSVRNIAPIPAPPPAQRPPMGIALMQGGAQPSEFGAEKAAEGTPATSHSSLACERRGSIMHASPNGESGNQLECQTEATADGMILRLSGEIDLVTAPLVFSTLQSMAEDDAHVIVDLSELGYMDSSGLHVLFAINRVFLDRRQRFVVSNPSAAVRKIMDIIEFDKIIPVFPSVEAAREFMRVSSAPPTEETRSA